MDLQCIYQKFPVFVQNTLLSLYGYRLQRQRFGRDFQSLLQESQRREFVGKIGIQVYQRQTWDLVIKPIVEQLPAYRDYNCDFDKLGNLPILTKEQVRQQMQDFLHPNWKKLHPVKAHTSGSTGAGFKFYTSQYAVQRQWAYWWRYRMAFDIPWGTWCGIFGGREVVPSGQKTGPFWRVNRGGNTVLFSQYHLSPENAIKYLQEIQDRGLQWLHGYPSLLALISKFGIEAGLAGTLPVKWVTLGAENLLPQQQTLIQQMFGVKPLQHYGLAEGVANISLCPHGNMHVDEDFSLVDFIPEPRGGYRVIGTTLDNKVMPLVRYDTNDIVTLSEDTKSCGCGRSGRIVTSIDGRQEDLIVLSDDSRVGRLDHLFKDATHVAEAQILQEKKGRAVFRIVKGQEYNKQCEEALRKECAIRFGKRLDVSFEYVPKIKKTASGKLRFVISQ